METIMTVKENNPWKNSPKEAVGLLIKSFKKSLSGAMAERSPFISDATYLTQDWMYG